MDESFLNMFMKEVQDANPDEATRSAVSAHPAAPQPLQAPQPAASHPASSAIPTQINQIPVSAHNAHPAPAYAQVAASGHPSTSAAPVHTVRPTAHPTQYPSNPGQNPHGFVRAQPHAPSNPQSQPHQHAAHHQQPPSAHPSSTGHANPNAPAQASTFRVPQTTSELIDRLIQSLSGHPTVDEYLQVLRPVLLQSEMVRLSSIFADYAQKKVSKEDMMQQFRATVSGAGARPLTQQVLQECMPILTGGRSMAQGQQARNAAPNGNMRNPPMASQPHPAAAGKHAAASHPPHSSAHASAHPTHPAAHPAPHPQSRPAGPPFGPPAPVAVSSHMTPDERAAALAKLQPEEQQIRLFDLATKFKNLDATDKQIRARSFTPQELQLIMMFEKTPQDREKIEAANPALFRKYHERLRPLIQEKKDIQVMFDKFRHYTGKEPNELVKELYNRKVSKDAPPAQRAPQQPAAASHPVQQQQGADAHVSTNGSQQTSAPQPPVKQEVKPEPKTEPKVEQRPPAPAPRPIPLDRDAQFAVLERLQQRMERRVAAVIQGTGRQVPPEAVALMGAALRRRMTQILEKVVVASSHEFARLAFGPRDQRIPSAVDELRRAEEEADVEYRNSLAASRDAAMEASKEAVKDVKEEESKPSESRKRGREEDSIEDGSGKRRKTEDQKEKKDEQKEKDKDVKDEKEKEKGKEKEKEKDKTADKKDKKGDSKDQKARFVPDALSLATRTFGLSGVDLRKSAAKDKKLLKTAVTQPSASSAPPQSQSESQAQPDGQAAESSAAAGSTAAASAQPAQPSATATVEGDKKSVSDLHRQLAQEVTVELRSLLFVAERDEHLRVSPWFVRRSMAKDQDEYRQILRRTPRR